MEKYVASLLTTLILGSSLCACTPLSDNEKRATVCRELNNKMTFGNSTSNTRTAEIQNSEDILRQQQYEKCHCDSI